MVFHHQRCRTDLRPLHNRGLHHAHCLPCQLTDPQLGACGGRHCPGLDLWLLASARDWRQALVQGAPCRSGDICPQERGPAQATERQLR